jgi:hypothetical protein
MNESERETYPDTIQLCMICAYEKPWGIYSEKTGAFVCIECRDKARMVSPYITIRDRYDKSQYPEPGEYLVALTDGRYRVEEWVTYCGGGWKNTNRDKVLAYAPIPKYMKFA